MKALLYERYDAGEVREIPLPDVPPDGVRVRVRAVSLNAMDHYFASGRPRVGRLMGGLTRPRIQVPGVDLAGTVEAVGRDAKTFRVGDEVLGGARGALAEYVCVAEARLAAKPAALTFEQAATLPVAGLTALQALRDHGRVQAGQRVLVNGASGGVGTFAVQIAKALGARVTGVCGTAHVELVRSLGAERVVDHAREDFTRGDARYDLMLDIAGSRGWHACARVLEPGANVVVIGGPRRDPWLGPLGHIVGMRLGALGSSRKAILFIARIERADLMMLAEWCVAGTLRPVIEQRFTLAEAAEAIRRVGAGHVGGKLVVTIG